VAILYVNQINKFRIASLQRDHELAQFNYEGVGDDILLFNAFIRETIEEFLFIYYNRAVIKDEQEVEILDEVKTQIVNNISPVLLHRISIVYNEENIHLILTPKIRLQLGDCINKHNKFVSQTKVTLINANQE
jgi:hypothetical protein